MEHNIYVETLLGENHETYINYFLEPTYNYKYLYPPTNWRNQFPHVQILVGTDILL
jgi:hypothetical protein